jgi:hypothetical protein
VAFLTSRTRRSRSSSIARTLVLALGLFTFVGEDAVAQAPAPSREYQVKAVFLFNFAQFVEWPPAVFTEESAPLAICVLGDDPFGPYLDAIVRGEQVNSRRLTVQRFHSAEEAKSCQVLFVSRSQERNLDKALAWARGMDALTVSDADDFAGRGGMIELKTEKGKIRIRINTSATKASSLVISSKLLRSAEIVANKDD